MSVAHPRSIEEWQAHVAQLSSEELWDKAAAANTVKFVESLQTEGYPAEDIEEIFLLMARRFKELEMVPPLEGYIDFRDLLDGVGS